MPAWKIVLDPLRPTATIDGVEIPDVVGVDLEHRVGALPGVAVIVSPGPASEVQGEGIVHVVTMSDDASEADIIVRFLEGQNAEELASEQLMGASAGQTPTERMLEILKERARDNRA